MQQYETVSPRKRDFRVSFTLEGIDETYTRELGLAVTRVVHSYLNKKVFFKISHHIDTEVHQLVDHICRNGLDVCEIEILHPARRDLTDRISQKKFRQKIRYITGLVTDQATVLSNEDDDGDDLMTDELEITFLTKEVVHRREKALPTLHVTGLADKVVHIRPRI